MTVVTTILNFRRLLSSSSLHSSFVLLSRLPAIRIAAYFPSVTITYRRPIWTLDESARAYGIDKSCGVGTVFFFFFFPQLRHFRSELPSFLNFSSSMVSCIVGSWLLSRNREFRFSRIGEIRRIDGNLISRERTTALKDFAYIYVCITSASVCVYVYNGKMFVSRADSGGIVGSSVIKRSRSRSRFMRDSIKSMVLVAQDSGT